MSVFNQQRTLSEMKNIKLVIDNVVNSQIFIHTLNNCKESMYSYGEYMNISTATKNVTHHCNIQASK